LPSGATLGGLQINVLQIIDPARGRFLLAASADAPLLKA
jgi:hypothetical protein